MLCGLSPAQAPSQDMGLSGFSPGLQPLDQEAWAPSAHHPFSKGMLGGGPNRLRRGPHSGTRLAKPQVSAGGCTVLPPPGLAGQSSPSGPSAALHPPAWGSRSPVSPATSTYVITRVPRRAQTHRPQLQWQTRSSPRRCGRM